MRRGRAEQQRVAVGLRLCDHLGADIAAGAALVVDDDLLAEIGRHADRDDARDQVGRPARRERHHHAQRLVGILRGGLPGRQKREGAREKRSNEEPHDQSTFAPAARMTSRHLAISAVTKARAGRRRIGDRLDAELLQPLRHRGTGQRLVDGGVQPVDDRLGRAGRHRHDVPGAAHEVGQPRLRRGRHVGTRLAALVGHDDDGIELAGLDLLQRRAERIEHEGHAAAHQVLQRRPRAAIGHMRGLDAGARLEQLAGQMVGRAVARRGVARLAFLGLQLGDQLGQRARLLGRDQQHHRHEAGQRHQLEILQRIVGKLVVERDVDAVRRGGAEQQRVTVGLRLGDLLGADRAAGAALVLDHDLLAELFRQRHRQDAREDVGRAARRERHDELHRLVRVLLRQRGRARQHQRQPRGQHPPRQRHVSSSYSFLGSGSGVTRRVSGSSPPSW